VLIHFTAVIISFFFSPYSRIRSEFNDTVQSWPSEWFGRS